MPLSHSSAAARTGPGLPLSFLRTRQWAHFVPLSAAGIEAKTLSAGSHLVLRLGLSAFVAACMFAYAYGLNAVVDRSTDRDAEKNPLVGLTVCPRSIAVLLAALCGAALVTAAALGPLSLAAAAASLLASSLYSAGPRLKARPVVGTLLNVGIFGPALILAMVPGCTPPGLGTLATAFSAMLLQNQLLHERADRDEDSGARVRTTASLLSSQQTLSLVWTVGLCGALAAGWLATSRLGVWTAASGFAATSLAAAIPRSWSTRRRLHRWVAAVAGAGLYASCWA
jgi:4-hydroxybenzoate polyprenyltransferase